MLEIHLYVSQKRELAVRIYRKKEPNGMLYVLREDNWKQDWEIRNLHPALRSDYTDFY